jgi:hypothetical protein
LFGSLLLAKDTWKDELSRKPEGLKLIEAVEEAALQVVGLELLNVVVAAEAVEAVSSVVEVV